MTAEPDIYTDLAGAKLLADEAFALLNKHGVDLVDDLPLGAQDWLDAMAGALWPWNDTTDRSFKVAAFSQTAAVFIAERLRREHKATMAGL